jgi:extracellular solute-binding protein
MQRQGRFGNPFGQSLGRFAKGQSGNPNGRCCAQATSLTVLHESSFIKTYDEHFQKVLAPAYEKETEVKVTYELTSVGSLQTRVTTVAETGSGADIIANAFSWPFLFDEKYLDVSDIAEEAGKKHGRLVRRGEGSSLRHPLLLEPALTGAISPTSRGEPPASERAR